MCTSVRDVFRWTVHHEFEDGMVDLGKCQQKPADSRWTVDGIHQLLLFIGTARTGNGAKHRAFQHKLDKAIAERERKKAFGSSRDAPQLRRPR